MNPNLKRQISFETFGLDLDSCDAAAVVIANKAFWCGDFTLTCQAAKFAHHVDLYISPPPAA